MKVVYSPRYHIDIGPHVYPTLKYALVYRAVTDLGAARADDFLTPQAASWDDLALVHTGEYLRKVREGTLSADEVAQLELPWSPEIVEGFRLMTGGTLVATRALFDASAPRVVVHLGGGFHHAFANHGEGFCLFNDVAVAIRLLQRDRLIARAAIVDCDVHHGNGTAFIFGGDSSVFTCSLHQQNNYPMFKPRSTLDIGLPDAADDEMYLGELECALPQVFASSPDVVFYLAGADPYQEDQLGGLALTREGLRRRDRLVLAAARSSGVPVAITLAGGYARRVEDTVAIHVATVLEASENA